MSRITAEFFVIILLSIYASTSFLTTSYVSLSVGLGIVGILLATFTTYRFPKYSFHVLLLLLILSIPNIISFSQVKFYVGINSFKISLIPAVLLVFICIERRKIIAEWFANDEQDQAETKQRKIDLFKNEFRNYSKDQIVNALENGKLVDEAKEALKELLKEKKG